MAVEAKALEWDVTGEHFYETGVSKGVLYKKNPTTEKWEGVAWNGLTQVNESPDGGEANPIWADDDKYLNIRGKEEFKATIEAYTYPDEFAECDGSASLEGDEGKGKMHIGQQKRVPFAFCYQTKVGSDTDEDYGYKIHIVYGCTANPSERSYQTVNDNPDAINFSWDVDTIPVNAPAIEGKNYKKTSLVVLESKDFPAETSGAKNTVLKKIEETLYGKNGDVAASEVIDQDLSNTEFTPTKGKYYRHTGETSQTYTKDHIYLRKDSAYEEYTGDLASAPELLFPQDIYDLIKPAAQG